MSTANPRPGIWYSQVIRNGRFTFEIHFGIGFLGRVENEQQAKNIVKAFETLEKRHDERPAT